jgi:anaerobic C4-dicarboxylate transporter
VADKTQQPSACNVQSNIRAIIAVPVYNAVVAIVVRLVAPAAIDFPGNENMWWTMPSVVTVYSPRSLYSGLTIATLVTKALAVLYKDKKYRYRMRHLKFTIDVLCTILVPSGEGRRVWLD